MPIQQLPIFCYYDVQRFTQFGSMDCANWYGVEVESGKENRLYILQWAEGMSIT